MIILPSSARQRLSRSSGRRRSGSPQEEARSPVRPSISPCPTKSRPDRSPRHSTADQTYRSPITDRQLGSLSAGRARLIGAPKPKRIKKTFPSELMIGVMERSENPPHGRESLQDGGLRSGPEKLPKTDQKVKSRSPSTPPTLPGGFPLAPLLFPTLFHLSIARPFSHFLPSLFVPFPPGERSGARLPLTP